MPDTRILWTLMATNKGDPEEQTTWGYGRTREEALDHGQIRFVDDIQEMHGRPGEDFDPEAVEAGMVWSNDVHGFFYANPEATELHDHYGYLWLVGWDYAPEWMQPVLTETPPA